MLHDLCLLFNLVGSPRFTNWEKFKEKHPTHRGLPVGNQVDGLPTELHGSDKTAFSRGQRVLMKIAIDN